MKYLLTLFLMFGINFSVFADDQTLSILMKMNMKMVAIMILMMIWMETLTVTMKTVPAYFLADSDDGFLGGNMSAYLVWGVGLALINSDFGSDSGTATTD